MKIKILILFFTLTYSFNVFGATYYFPNVCVNNDCNNKSDTILKEVSSTGQIDYIADISTIPIVNVKNYINNNSGSIDVNSTPVYKNGANYYLYNKCDNNTCHNSTGNFNLDINYTGNYNYIDNYYIKKNIILKDELFKIETIDENINNIKAGEEIDFNFIFNDYLDYSTGTTNYAYQIVEKNISGSKIVYDGSIEIKNSDFTKSGDVSDVTILDKNNITKKIRAKFRKALALYEAGQYTYEFKITNKNTLKSLTGSFNSSSITISPSGKIGNQTTFKAKMNRNCTTIINSDSTNDCINNKDPGNDINLYIDIYDQYGNKYNSNYFDNEIIGKATGSSDDIKLSKYGENNYNDTGKIFYNIDDDAYISKFQIDDNGMGNNILKGFIFNNDSILSEGILKIFILKDKNNVDINGIYTRNPDTDGASKTYNYYVNNNITISSHCDSDLESGCNNDNDENIEFNKNTWNGKLSTGYLKAYDNANNQTTFSYDMHNIDITKPIINITADGLFKDISNGKLYSNGVDIEVKFEDEVKNYFAPKRLIFSYKDPDGIFGRNIIKINGVSLSGQTEQGNVKINKTFNKEGTYKVYLFGYDYGKKNTDPSISLEGHHIKIENNGEIKVLPGKNSDLQNCNGTNTNCKYNFNEEILNTGNLSGFPPNFDFMIDKTKPSMTLNNLEDKWYNSGSLDDLILDASDWQEGVTGDKASGLNKIEIKLNGVNILTNTNVKINGNSVYNTGTTTNESIKISKNPVVYLGSTYGNYTFTGFKTDGIDQKFVKIPKGYLANITNPSGDNILKEGDKNTLYIKIYDRAGNYYEKEYNIKYDNSILSLQSLNLPDSKLATGSNLIIKSLILDDGNKGANQHVGDYYFNQCDDCILSGSIKITGPNSTIKIHTNTGFTQESNTEINKTFSLTGAGIYNVTIKLEDKAKNTKTITEDITIYPNLVDETKSSVSLDTSTAFNTQYANGQQHYKYNVTLKDEFGNNIYSTGTENQIKKLFSVEQKIKDSSCVDTITECNTLYQAIIACGKTDTNCITNARTAYNNNNCSPRIKECRTITTDMVGTGVTGGGSGSIALETSDFDTQTDLSGKTSFNLKSITPGMFSQNFKFQMNKWGDDYKNKSNYQDFSLSIKNTSGYIIPNYFKKPYFGFVEAYDKDLGTTENERWENGKPNLGTTMKYRLTVTGSIFDINKTFNLSDSSGSLFASKIAGFVGTGTTDPEDTELEKTLRITVQDKELLENEDITGIKKTNKVEFQARINKISGDDEIDDSYGVGFGSMIIDYILGNKKIIYYLSANDGGTDRTPIKIASNPFRGASITGPIQSSGNSEITGQGENMSDLSANSMRAEIRKIAYTFIKSLNSNTTVNGVKYVVGEDYILSGTQNYETLVVKNGNVIIAKKSGDEEIKRNDGKPLGIIVLKDDNYDVTSKNNGYSGKGNVYIKPGVNNINAVIYADGGIISSDGNGDPYIEDSEERTNTLNQNLTIKGSIFTRNTIGGAILNNGKYILPGGKTTTNFDNAMIYDLNYLRRGCIDTDCTASLKIEYDPKIQTNPPKLFYK